MVRELSDKVPAFRGITTHTRCFLHTVNLVAKSLIWEFDTKKQDADQALAEEELSMEIEENDGMIDDGDTAEDNDDGLIDEVELLDDTEQFALENDIWPVKLALVKVSAK